MSIFKFKQFEVDQSGCAMKINTDGVLLAASAHQHEPKRILDIGTGTGVIALMLAQRFPRAIVHAVEIDKEASETAKKNFSNSNFSNRLSVTCTAFEEYDSVERFDLIVSNPPFFVNDLKNAEVKKGVARHTTDAFFEMLIDKSASMLSEQGTIWLILPLKQVDYVIKISSTYGLFLQEIIHIHSDNSKPTFRQMICLSKTAGSSLERDFYIYESLQQHTSAYKDLLKDFFLAF
ncbi:tRNA methyltransferase [Pedobacter yonginense]|uniref:tRNA1(Val) (adenine(37)-N6)-methyltransferase n=1 Tax=Pedobacter yonginense TaxID=651869 RepID=A0A317ES62_9SPHI|nr:methyltransferase [Pedobacter yonginense]PWS28693.1 tRNA methyltransferase [Pedobacter yonginense]